MSANRNERIAFCLLNNQLKACAVKCNGQNEQHHVFLFDTFSAVRCRYANKQSCDRGCWGLAVAGYAYAEIPEAVNLQRNHD